MQVILTHRFILQIKLLLTIHLTGHTDNKRSSELAEQEQKKLQYII